MMQTAARAIAGHSRNASSDRATIDFLQAMVVAPPYSVERFHAVFLDRNRGYLGDAPMGQGGLGCLSLRMRELFARALALSASGMLLAHNHPSGQCRPSAADIAATRRVEQVATALDIELLDHLIFTRHAVYSMRAGALHEFLDR
jgi:DNA repair protein RadC